MKTLRGYQVPTVAINHISIWVKDLDNAQTLMSYFGFEVEEGDHHPAWNTGNSVFVRAPFGARIQLTVETEGNPGEPSVANHIAFSTYAPEAILCGLKECALQSNITVETEEGGPGKTLVLIPEVFYGGFELIDLTFGKTF